MKINFVVHEILFRGASRGASENGECRNAHK